MSKTAWCKKIQTAAWKYVNKIWIKYFHTNHTYVNKLWSKTQNWSTQYYLFYFRGYKDNSFSITFYVNSKKFKEDNSYIRGYIYFYSVPFNVFSIFICSARNFNFKQSTTGMRPLKPLSLLQCHFRWICEVYSVDARDQLTATAYSPKKIKGTQLNNTFLMLTCSSIHVTHV